MSLCNSAITEETLSDISREDDARSLRDGIKCLKELGQIYASEEMERKDLYSPPA